MSSIIPTSDEQSLISSIFSLADPQSLGIVTGDAAVKVLSSTNLPNSVLGEIWTLADKENNGFLTRNGLAVAVRLIGYAQKGQSVSDPSLLSKPGPIAVFEGISLPSKSSSDSLETSLPLITQQDKTKFLKLFVNCGPSNGLLSSDKAKDILIKSKLPYEKLSQIWTLADSKVRGALDATDFIIAMYLLQLCMTSSSFVLPSTLPPSLYEQASLTPDSAKGVTSHATGTSFSGSLTSPASTQMPMPILKQATGQSVSVSGGIRSQYTGQQPTSLSPAPTARSPHGDIYPQTKVPSDVIFEQLDTQHKGYIEADVAVPFMLKTGLSSTDLAQIWDLADINHDGRLTQTGFAIAMRLISSGLAGTGVPPTLPHNLASSPTPSQLIKTPALSDLDLLFDTNTLPANQSQATGGTTRWNAQGGKISASPPVSPVRQPQFQLQPQQFPIQIRDQGPPAQTFDLLGDEDDVKAVVPNHSIEIGNLHNQLSSTARSLEIAKTEKQSAEKIVQQQAEELAQLQTQLATARASYEMETKLLADLRERSLTQQAEISKTREELITAEGELSAVKVERNDIQSALLRDKEEVRELQRRLREVGTETESSKVELEKIKRDARQQKGLLAIAKKQLATAELENSKVHKEIESAKAEIDAVMKEKAITETNISEFAAFSTGDSLIQDSFESPERVKSPVPSLVAATVPLPSTPALTSSPAARQSTNPFDLLILGGAGSFTSEVNGSIDSKPSLPILPDFAIPVTTGSPFTTARGENEDAARPSMGEATFSFVEKFPEIETQRPLSPESTATSKPDLDASLEESLSPLHEVENDGNSSSDSKDEEPLSILKEKVSKATNGNLSSQGHELGAEANGLHVPNSSHEDLFGLSGPNVVTTSSKSESARAKVDSPSADTDDPFGVPMSTTSPTALAHDDDFFSEKAAFEFSPPSATVKDFDEGFNNIPQDNKEVLFNPNFDGGFDDFFDFSKVAAAEGKHPQPSSEVGRSNVWSAALSAKPTEIEESSATVPTLASDKLPPVEQQPPITFDDILQFSNPTSNDTPAGASVATTIRQDSTMSASHAQNRRTVSLTPQATETPNPFPRSSSNEVERQTFNSSPTPQRSYSPPIRPASPRLPRVSIGLPKNSPPNASSPKSKISGSNSKAVEIKSENPSKHKLSIRFFGKKDKKDKEDKRGPPKHQGQSIEQAVPTFAEPFATGIATGTPAADDDVEAVKQLSAMGFSRSQAIAALETHGYDVQRALNSLLGA